MLRILAVCTGNTCRSPMAEVLLREKIRQHNFDQLIEVASAGLTAGGGPASAGARTVMRDRGLDLGNHCSRPFTALLAAEFDLILTMTEDHRRMIMALAPAARGKVFTLAEFAGVTGDLPDPYGGGEAEYRVCAEKIDALLDKAWNKIKQLAGKYRRMAKTDE